MDLDLVTDETSDDENYGFDDTSEGYLNVEGERCGICMDVVIDRGVLDCCQHWFCFACIDNWATITSLCPLCQNEFHLITCVPVYDTVGGNRTDDDTNIRDDDWCIEGKSSTVSFPSYYIDENAVGCLDGDSCKIRSGSVAIEEDSDIDTSIACDSCDKWYHAYCVGFDPEGSCDSSWMCPRCTLGKSPEASFSGGVSVSVADDGETAVIISLFDGNQENPESSQSALGCSKDMGNTFLPSSISCLPKPGALAGDREGAEPNSCQQGIELTSSPNNLHTSSHVISPAELKTNADDSVVDSGFDLPAVIISLFDGNQENPESSQSALGCSKDMGNTFLPSSISCLPKPGALAGDREGAEPNSCQQGIELTSSPNNLHTSSHVISPAELKTNADDSVVDSGFDLPDMKDNDAAENEFVRSMETDHGSEDPIPVVFAGKMVSNEIEDCSLGNRMPDEKPTTSGITGAKRMHRDSSNADDRGREDNIESRKKIKADKNSEPTSVPVDSRTIKRSNLRDSTSRCKSDKEKGTPNIMDIVQGVKRRSLKQPEHKNSPREGESAAKLRLKKIMRRPGEDDKDSSMVVQEIRKKIRATVRNKSSGENLLDPKLLDAFRAALAGSEAQNRKPVLDVRAKMSLLQKGKVRENLTKKIYGAGGKRKRAWNRECEVEFWKHRCLQASKPEKIQTLKSVLDLLRDHSSDSAKEMTENGEEETKGSVLSRLYLADTSVFPRKNDITPLCTAKPDNTLSDSNSQNRNSLSGLSVTPIGNKETKKSVVKGVKSENAFKGKAISSEKEKACKPDMVKGDRRQWALELLARKTSVSGKNIQEREVDTAILKGNYTLLAQLPKEMRPVLAPSRHNKIPESVRKTQLYRLTEHFLKKANVSVVSRTAESELAVADAVNIEKQVADRSNSKLVYLNLCSQELSRRSDNINSDRPREISTGATEETNNTNGNNDTSLDLDDIEALKRAGLMSDSPPTSPNHHPMEHISNGNNGDNSDDEGPENVLEAESHSEFDIYGDFEYNLEDDDFIGAGTLSSSNTCKSQPEPEPPKLKMLFSSLKIDKLDEIAGPPSHEIVGPPSHEEALVNSSGIVESQDEVTGKNECPVQSSSVENEELSIAECEELYGPDKEPLIKEFPVATPILPLEQTVQKSGSQERENVAEKEKTGKSEAKQSELRRNITKKVEAYIKEHIRPLCKSNVITVDQYRWAVGKTTEKVMKYHTKEKNANFLIKEGEKVKKLAEQYAEASQMNTNS